MDERTYFLNKSIGLLLLLIGVYGLFMLTKYTTLNKNIKFVFY